MTVDRHLQAMFDDLDLTGDLLLITIALWTIRERTNNQEVTWKQLSIATGFPTARIAAAIRDDVPRYQQPRGSWTCTAPMVRRDGPCGQSATAQLYDFDPTTGARWPVSLCRRHMPPQLGRLVERNRQQWIANGSPTPPHNAGGILARHLPTIKWTRIYEALAPGGQMTPGTGKPAAPSKGHLTLIAGAGTPTKPTPPPGNDPDTILLGAPHQPTELPKFTLIRGDQR